MYENITHYLVYENITPYYLVYENITLYYLVYENITLYYLEYENITLYYLVYENILLRPYSPSYPCCSPERETKVVLAAVAAALTRVVLLQPGGPNNRIPLPHNKHSHSCINSHMHDHKSQL